MSIIIDREYYLVELYNKQPPQEMFEWLQDSFGDGKDGRWFYRHPDVGFINKSDHLMFVIRWS